VDVGQVSDQVGNRPAGAVLNRRVQIALGDRGEAGAVLGDGVQLIKRSQGDATNLPSPQVAQPGPTTRLALTYSASLAEIRPLASS
jgi:predicted phage gp36 major capsid-like protein